MSAPRYNLSEDEDDDLFGDNPGSLSDSTGVSYSKFSQQRAHPSGALPKPSSISPDLLAALTHDELYHNQQYRKTHEKVANLEHTVSEMVCEIVELRRTCKGIALSTTPVVNDTSLTPSDSFSHVLSGTVGDPPLPPPSTGSAPQPPSLVRPQHLPQSVLWTSEDAKNDPLVGIKKSNQSRAPMDRAIRLSNGTGISKSQWITDPRSIDQPRKKRYFKTFFPNEWNTAVTELEAAAPLLTLCADHWKAESTLGALLRDRHLPSRPPSPHSPPPQQSRLSSELSSAPASSGPQTQKTTEGGKSKRPRARSPTQRPNKKAKHDGQKGKETSGTGTGVSGGLPPASPPSTPAFLAMARAAAPSQQPRARPRANFKDIIVCPSASNLIDVITNDFPTVPDAADLLRAMHDATDCETRKPSNSVTALLDRLDSADPDAPDVDDDDSNENWGHAQFTAGSLTIRSALVDWESSSSASPLAPAPAASGSSDAEPAPSKSKPAPKSKAAPKPKAAPSKPKAAPSKPKAAPSKPKAAPSKSHAAPSNSSGTAPAAPTEPSPTKPSGAKAGPSKLSGTKAGPSKSAKRTEPAASESSPTEPASKRATLSRAAKAHRGAPMDQDESASQEASSEG
ncbi:hypothetical protein EDB84DRAFT_1570578 [Lactarius hengduanensis]|nr:hypothetical protein EDB84DRAFT_1570578 [Lactarius hengduanensis]